MALRLLETLSGARERHRRSLKEHRTRRVETRVRERSPPTGSPDASVRHRAAGQLRNRPRRPFLHVAPGGARRTRGQVGAASVGRGSMPPPLRL